MYAQGFGPWGCWGSKIYFSEHDLVAFFILLKGMNSSPGYSTLKSLPYNQTGYLGMLSKGQLPLNFFESVGICDGVPSNVF